MGNRSLADKARAAADRLDPDAAAERHRLAAQRRRVTLRPTDDSMVRLCADLELADGVLVEETLRRDVEQVVASGKAAGRTAGQVAADLLVERVTGRSPATAAPVQLNLVLSDQTLLVGGDEPAVVPGHGTVPAQVARRLVAGAIDVGQAWVRRLYATPTGRLVAMSSNQRFAPPGLAAFLRIRDHGRCRTPWCDAPIRHVDHVEEHESGGATSEANTQGACVSCNHAKQAPMWRHTPTRTASGVHQVDIETPTGHRYESIAPPPPRAAEPAPAMRPTGPPAVLHVYHPGAPHVQLEWRAA